MTKELMDKAEKALTSSRLLPETGDTGGATNRAYYAVFDAVAWSGQQVRHKTHNGLIASFGLHLVRPGLLTPEFGRSLNRPRDLRLTGDYLTDPVPLEKAEWALQEANAFVAGIRQLLSNPGPKTAA